MSAFCVLVVVLPLLVLWVPRLRLGVRSFSFCGVTVLSLFVVVGSVVVVVLCRGVGVVVWWGSWCVVVTWSWWPHGRRVVVAVGRGGVADVGGLVVVSGLTWDEEGGCSP